MGNLLTVLQLVGSFVAFGLIIYVYRAKPSEAQKVLFAGTIFIYINMLGYYFELSAHTIETAMIGLKMEYIGNTLGSLLFIFFVCIYSPNRRYRLWKIFYLFNNLFILFLVLTSPEHTLYYKEIKLLSFDGYTYLELTPGIFYYWWVFTSVVLGLLVVYIASTAYRDHKHGDHPEYTWIIAAAAIPTLAWPINIFHALGTYDIGPLTLLVTSLCLAVITSKYRMFNTVATAKDRIIDELEEGIIVYNNEDELVYFNKEAAEIFPVFEQMQKEEARHSIEAFLDKNAESFMKEGRHYLWKRQLLHDNQNHFLGEIVTIVDNTDSYQYTSRLIELKNDAERANRSKSMFLTNISHEIRTPLNAIMGMDELILRECKSKEVSEYASNIKEAGSTLLSIINDLLDTSKIESGKIEITPDKYELNSTLYNLSTMISVKVEEAGLIFHMEVDEKLPNQLYGDETRLKQCIMNLLTNSVKYTKKGSIQLRVGYEVLDDNKIMLLIQVEDTGIGIKASDIGRIFNTFERVDNQKNKGIEGTGLGLNITKELVELMGGSLKVKSVYGEGSTFYISLPQLVTGVAPIGRLDLSRPLFSQTAVPEFLFFAPKARILIVDDNAVNISVVKGLLKRSGIQTDMALSGPECLDKVSKNYYDIILMDHMMPGMDGIETLKKLRKMPDCLCRESPCIVLTANAVAGSREMYLKEDFSDYIAKPIKPEEMYRILRRFLPEELVSEIKENEELTLTK